MTHLPSRRWRAALLAAPLALAAALSAAPARAQSAPPAGDAGERSVGLWYGWQTLIAVAPFDIAMFVGLARYDDRYGQAVFTTGFVGRNLAPAVVHLANRRPGLAFGSVGLHAVATATGVAVGYAVGIAIQSRECAPGEGCCTGVRDLPPGPGYGAIAGSMVGTVLDVVFLATRPRSSWASSQTASTTWTMSPYATPTGLGVAAGGTF